eukprot:gene4252-4962_t
MYSIQSIDDYNRFEVLCHDSFQKPQEAVAIEEVLQAYFFSPNFLVEYKRILEFSKSSYVVAQICRGLTRCVTQFWNSIPPAQRADFNTLPQVDSFAISTLLKLYSRLVKFTWQEETNKNVFLDAIVSMAKKSHEHHAITLKMLRDIICEFNDQTGDHLSMAQQRNLSISLRQSVLMRFFTVSLDSLKQVVVLQRSDPVIDKVRDNALELSLSCLSFDFIKTTSIDSSEEILTVQIPGDWKSIFEDPDTTNLYFKIYKSTYSTKSLECIIYVTSVRRSLFNEDDRIKFLTNIIKGTMEILQHNIGFQNENNHLSFCRILERIKTNYHLNQLIAIDGYQEWLALLSKFTIDTLKNPQFSPNSVYFLLSLWAKFVASIIHIKGDTTKTFLDKYTPLIMETFLNSKIEASSFLDDEDERVSRVALELSFIYFMQSFRKIYIGEHTISSSKIYPRISELLGPTDHNSIMFSIIGKIGFNFKYWCDEDDVIKRSLEMFWDTVNGHSTSKILLNTPITHNILKNHNSELFPFLDRNSNTRHRTTLYKAIGKLLFTDENIGFFDDFIAPFDATLVSLQSIQTREAFRTEDTKRKIIGLMRDLRGIVCSTGNKRSFIQFFEWINPRFTDVLLRIVNSFYDASDVMVAVLKFLSEYVFNKQARLNFDTSSPTGFIIFRETSKIIHTYDLYKYKLKGISICMTIFTRCLHGGYCNFGVFDLFGDKSFYNFLDIVFQLLISITLEELMCFPKVSKIHILMLEVLCNNHTLTIIELNSKYFGHVMCSILKGLDTPQDITFSTQACTALDRIMTSCYQHTKKKDSALIKTIMHHFNEHPTLLFQIMDKILTLIISEDNLSQFASSKPLLGCIIFSQDTFNAVKQKFIQMNPSAPDKVDLIFTQLMADVQDNLDTKNRDRFSQNMATLRTKMRALGTPRYY